ncbi:hypothetical protein ABY43_28525 [Rhizobium giardinii]
MPTQYSLAFSISAVSFFGVSQATGWFGERFGLVRGMRVAVTAFALTMATMAIVMGLGFNQLPLLVAFIVGCISSWRRWRWWLRRSSSMAHGEDSAVVADPGDGRPPSCGCGCNRVTTDYRREYQKPGDLPGLLVGVSCGAGTRLSWKIPTRALSCFRNEGRGPETEDDA